MELFDLVGFLVDSGILEEIVIKIGNGIFLNGDMN